MRTTNRSTDSSTPTEGTPMLASSSAHTSPAARRHAWVSRVAMVAAYGSVLWVVLAAGLCNPPRPGDFHEGPSFAAPASPAPEQLVA